MKHSTADNAMREYAVSFIPNHEIDSLKSSWDALYKGKDLTYHNSFDWYKMLVKFTPLHKCIDCGYFVVKKNDVVCLIAPLWVVKRRFGFVNPKGIYFIGRKGYTDYLNFIYDTFDEKAADSLMCYMRDRYGRRIKWHFEQLKEDSELYRYILRCKAEQKCHVSLNYSGVCPSLTLSDSVEAYNASLSKSVRQNLRTAVNRIKKNNLDYEICIDNREIDPTICNNLRESWRHHKKQFEKSGASWKGKIYLWLSENLYEKHQIQFGDYVPIINDKNSRLLTITIAGELAAFFCYGNALVSTKKLDFKN